MIDYPQRESFFAMRFLRLLTKSAAAMQVGTEGFALLMIIVGQEDACRYTRPVNFWNAQLAALIGLRGVDEHALRRIRDRCVRAGWLQYAAGNKQLPARYFVTIPAAVNTLPDSSSDESPQEYSGQTADIQAQTRQESGENAAGKRQESGRNTAPSIPNPIPNPIPKSAAAPPPAPARAAADPMEMDSMQAAPPAQEFRPKADWNLWRQTHPRLFIGRSDEDGCVDDWRALFDRGGDEVMTAMYAAVLRGIANPRHGIGFKAAAEWIHDNTEPA